MVIVYILPESWVSWLKPVVLKTTTPLKGVGSSNLPLSAIFQRKQENKNDNDCVSRFYSLSNLRAILPQGRFIRVQHLRKAVLQI
jgi:hypothetical protein